MLAPIASFLITLLVTTFTLLAIARLPFCIEIDGRRKAILAGLVFTSITVLVRPIMALLSFLPPFFTLGLLWFGINAIAFALVAWLVEGFRLTWGFASAMLGAIVLTVVNNLLVLVFTRLSI